GHGTRCPGQRMEPAAHVVRARREESVDQPPNVVRGVPSMRDHPHDNLTARLGDYGVERRRRALRWVVQHAHPRLPRGDLQDAVAGPVVAHAVHHHDLQQAGRIVAAEDGPEARLDVAPLVPARHDDAHRGERRLNHRTAPWPARASWARAPWWPGYETRGGRSRRR